MIKRTNQNPYMMPKGYRDGFSFKDASKAFDRVYQEQLWSKAGDGSGGDSCPDVIHPFFPILLDIIKHHQIVTIGDFGCGSHYVFKDFVWPAQILYHGFDVSSIALAKAKDNCKYPQFQFSQTSDYKTIPYHDLLIIKDVLCHWSIDQGHELLDYFKHKMGNVLVAGIVELHLTDKIEQEAYASWIFRTLNQEEYGMWLFKNPNQ